MVKNLSAEQTGKIVKVLRAKKQISQEQLAGALEIPRSSVSQIENGGRELSFTEFQKLLSIFEISFDEFLNLNQQGKKITFKKDKSVNSSIKFEPEKFKQLLLYILEKCGSNPNVGETVLYKLLYFCDFDYFETYEKALTGMKYKKMQFGPIPDQTLFNTVIKEMREYGVIERVSRPYIYDTIQTKYINFVSADLSIFGSEAENMRKTVDSVIGKLSHMSARQIEDYSHRDYPWQLHEFNEEIDYSSVFYRNGEFANRDYDQEFIDNAAVDVIKDLHPMSQEEYEYYMSLPE
jgi:transcriptional regulator with XRE-family HTH domain